VANQQFSLGVVDVLAGIVAEEGLKLVVDLSVAPFRDYLSRVARDSDYVAFSNC
jgi:hypothetical protein